MGATLNSSGAARLVLIGPPGAGKSAAGELAARRLGWSFIDTDALIEAQEGLSIGEIFERHGEPYFRKVETSVISEIEPADNTVLATGGGAILTEENRKRLGGFGLVVYLKPSTEIAWSRVSQGVRPVITEGKAGLEVLMNDRNALYTDAADLVIESDEGIESIADALVGLVTR